ncbi:MAG: hypothetical protein ACRD4S_13240, partial [Candidatus Acidiferrales bacterium]
MMIIGCDFHTRYQQIAMMDDATGELVERRLDHERRVAEAFAFDFSGAPPLWFVNGGDLILVFFARDCLACRIFSTTRSLAIAPDRRV